MDDINFSIGFWNSYSGRDKYSRATGQGTLPFVIMITFCYDNNFHTITVFKQKGLYTTNTTTINRGD